MEDVIISIIMYGNRRVQRIERDSRGKLLGHRDAFQTETGAAQTYPGP